MQISDIDTAIRFLLKPAGDDPRFSSWDNCLENGRELCLAVHRGFKALHFETLPNIITADAYLSAAAKKRELNSGVVAAKDYRLLWRKINDSIIWTLLRNQRHLLKRFCLYREHGYLAYSNYESIVKVLTQLNAPDTSMAIWTDATSCVDIGDIFIRDLENEAISVIEVKEGKVNEEILNFSSRDSGSAFSFFENYGEVGVKQIKRMLKQARISSQAMELMNKEKGIDPVTGKYTSILDLSIAEDTYDYELNDILDTAKNKGSACHRIGNCLWIYAFNRSKHSRDHLAKFSESVLSTDNGSIRNWVRQCTGQTNILPVVSLRDGLNSPISKPIYLRGINIEHILSIVHFDLSLLLFFDWAGFASEVVALGAKFEWSSRKNGRREKSKPARERALTIGDYIPQICKEEFTMSLGAPPFLHVIFGGMAPMSYARNNVATFDHLGEISKNLDNRSS